MASKRTGKIPPPIVLAINVCEDVLLYEESAVLDLYRCFTSIVCSEFPAVQASIFVHVDLTNGRGNVELSLTLYPNPTDTEVEPILELRETVFFGDPRDIDQICFELGPAVFEAPGEHTITVRAGDERIAERRVFVVLEN